MNSIPTVNALILSIYRNLAEEFVDAMVPQPGGEITLGDSRIVFTVVAGDPAQATPFNEHIAKADVIALLVRFLDVLSLDKIKAIYRHLPVEAAVPVAIFLLRDKGEIDFKISCPSCGQKLWLRDTDVGKCGRCPNCKKPFIILSQADHLKTQLMLPETVPILTVTKGDANSLQQAMARLIEARPSAAPLTVEEIGAEALKNATMRIQIQDNGGNLR